MHISQLGSIVDLAVKQLNNEIEAKKRNDYTIADVLEYSIIIRRQLDRFGSNGKIKRVKNIHTKKIISLIPKKRKENKEWQKIMKMFK